MHTQAITVRSILETWICIRIFARCANFSRSKPTLESLIHYWWSLDCGCLRIGIINDKIIDNYRTWNKWIKMNPIRKECKENNVFTYTYYRECLKYLRNASLWIYKISMENYKLIILIILVYSFSGKEIVFNQKIKMKYCKIKSNLISTIMGL